MRRLARYPIPIVLLLIFSVGAPASQDLPDVFDRLVTKALEESGIPSVSIVSFNTEGIVWTEAFGYADTEKEKKATVDTVYLTGSTFKGVTAMAALRLQEQGRVDLDKNINEYLGEDAIVGSDQVTLRQLLSHTSGLSDVWQAKPTYNWQEPHSPLANLIAVTDVAGDWSTFRYCNSCIAMAAHVMERAGRKDFDEIVVKQVLRPLGLPYQRLSTPEPWVQKFIATPYRMVDGVITPSGITVGNAWPAGDVYLRPVHMAEILRQHLVTGGLLTSESLKELQTEQHPGTSYGLGTGVHLIDGIRVISHAGRKDGYEAIFSIDLTSGVGVYIAANLRVSSCLLEPLASRVIRVMRGEPLKPIPVLQYGCGRE